MATHLAHCFPCKTCELKYMERIVAYLRLDVDTESFILPGNEEDNIEDINNVANHDQASYDAKDNDNIIKLQESVDNLIELEYEMNKNNFNYNEAEYENELYKSQKKQRKIGYDRRRSEITSDKLSCQNTDVFHNSQNYPLETVITDDYDNKNVNDTTNPTINAKVRTKSEDRRKSYAIQNDNHDKSNHEVQNDPMNYKTFCCVKCDFTTGMEYKMKFHQLKKHKVPKNAKLKEGHRKRKYDSIDSETMSNEDSGQDTDDVMADSPNNPLKIEINGNYDNKHPNNRTNPKMNVKVMTIPDKRRSIINDDHIQQDQNDSTTCKTFSCVQCDFTTRMEYKMKFHQLKKHKKQRHQSM